MNQLLRSSRAQLFMLAIFLSPAMQAQSTGDFRTTTATAVWSNLSSWQTWNGTQWITASSIPGSTNNVYIQAGHVVSLNTNQNCRHLFISTGTVNGTTGGDGQLALGANTLNVSGKISCYYGMVDTITNSTAALSITPSTTLPAAPITITNGSTGKLNFTGLSRIITATGEWSAGNSGAATTFAVEINMNPGETASMQTAIKASSWRIISGTLDAGSNTLSADRGTTGQGDITIDTGATLRSAQSSSSNPVFQRTSTSRAGTLTLNGRLILTGATPYIQMNTVALNGTVSYASTASQTLAQAQYSGAPIDNYTHLVLSGGGTKIFPANIMVSGNYAIHSPASGTITINGSSLSLSLGGNYTHMLNGTGSIAYTSAAEYDLLLNGSATQTISGGGVPITVKNLSISNTNSIFLNGTNSVLSVKGNLTHNGTTSSTGKLVLAGALQQAISGNGTVANLELSNSNGALITAGTNKLQVTGLLTLTSGTLVTNDNLVLKSTSPTSSAMVGPVLSAAGITGKVKHERFLSAPLNGSSGRSWRLLTSPLRGGTGNSIFFNWQNNGIVDGTGLEIWAPGGTGPSGNGLATGAGASLRTFNYLTNAYLPVTNTTTQPLFDTSGNKPFLAFVTGPYGSGNIGSGAMGTNCDATGALITGTQTYNFTAPNNSAIYYLIGNPYACPIDFDAIWNNTGTSNVNRKFWVIDPGVGNMGGYATVTYSNGAYITSVGNQNRYIQNGQAFFVEATTPNQPSSVVIEENDKKTDTPQTAMFRTNGATLETFRVLLRKQISGSSILLDGTVAACHQDNNNSVDAADAIKFSNFGETICIQSGGHNLAIESRQLYDAGDTLKLGVGNLQQATYQLDFEPGNINVPYLNASLYDAFLDSFLSISLTSASSYQFNVTADTMSSASSRFLVVFGGTNPLNEIEIQLEARQEGKKVSLAWQASDEEYLRRFAVQRSNDGINFAEIGWSDARASGSYRFEDPDPAIGMNLYRIHTIGRNNSGVFSRVAAIYFGTVAPHVNVIPNPATAGQVQIRLSGIEKGGFVLTIISSTGQTITSKAFSSEGAEAIITMNTDALPPGVFVAQVSTEQGIKIAETKFSKQ